MTKVAILLFLLGASVVTLMFLPVVAFFHCFITGPIRGSKWLWGMVIAILGPWGGILYGILACERQSFIRMWSWVGVVLTLFLFSASAKYIRNPRLAGKKLMQMYDVVAHSSESAKPKKPTATTLVAPRKPGAIVATKTQAELLASMEVVQGLNAQFKNDSQKALAHFNKALQIDPQSESALVHRGSLQKSLGEKTKAHHDFRAGLRILEAKLASDPKNLQNLKLRATAREGIGDRRGALADIEVLMRAQPKEFGYMKVKAEELRR